MYYFILVSIFYSYLSADELLMYEEIDSPFAKIDYAE